MSKSSQNSIVLGVVVFSIICAYFLNVSPSYGNGDWQLLEQKGVVVMMRHTLAPGTGDPANFRLNDCSTQRNLSAEGKKQARRIGEEFRQRKIKVSQVLSSQWCRCQETAKLLDLGVVKLQPALNSFFRDRTTESKQTELVRRLISEHRTQNGVMVLVTHQVNITALVGVVPAAGASVILRANPNGKVELLGELPPVSL
jgi:phosphohistidine phosphatase SixA